MISQRRRPQRDCLIGRCERAPSRAHRYPGRKHVNQRQGLGTETPSRSPTSTLANLSARLQISETTQLATARTAAFGWAIGTRPRHKERERCSRDDAPHRHARMVRPTTRPSPKRDCLGPGPNRGRGRKAGKRTHRPLRRMADRHRTRGVPARRVPRAGRAAGLHAKRH